MKPEQPTKEDVDQLKGWIEQNNMTVYTIIRHVSSSGMQREISVVIPIVDIPRYDNSGDKPILILSHVKQFVHPSYTIAALTKRTYSEKNGHNAVVCKGAGMDMGWDLINNLSYALYGNEKVIKQEWL